MSWGDAEAVSTRRRVATRVSRQVQRLERALPEIADAGGKWLEHDRAGQAVWLLAAKEADFAGLVVAGYRSGRYAAIAALTRTLYEDATLLAWCAIPDDSNDQRPRVLRVLLDYWRRQKAKGYALPRDAEQVLKDITGKGARKPPSMEDRAKQLDEAERKNTETGKPFWESHLDHVEMLNDFVHAELGGGPVFTDPMTRELLGFEALLYAHQYLSLSIVSVVRLTGLDKLAEQAQAAFGRIHDTEMKELNRLLKDPAGRET